MNLNSANWENKSTIEAVGGSRIRFDGDWSNSGTVSLNDSTLSIFGGFVQADLGMINRTGSTTINLVGEHDFGAAGLTLDASTGDFTLAMGTVLGTVNQAGGKLLISDSSSNVLDGATINGDLFLTNALSKIRLQNDVTVNGDVFATGTSSKLIFVGASNGSSSIPITFDNGGTVHLDNGSTIGTIGGVTNFTIGATTTIRGTGTIQEFLAETTFVNAGVITADIADKTLKVAPPTFINTGTMRAENGGRLDILAATWENQGTIESTGASTLFFGVDQSSQDSWVNNGTVNLTDSTLFMQNFSTSSIGTINRSGNSTIHVSNWDNTNTTYTLDATTGDYELGSVVGGTINQTANGKLIFSTNSASTVDGTTINGGLDLSDNFRGVRFENGGTFSGDADLGRFANLSFAGTIGSAASTDFTLNNGSTINLGRSSEFGTSGNINLTIGSTVTVRGEGNISRDVSR